MVGGHVLGVICQCNCVCKYWYMSHYIEKVLKSFIMLKNVPFSFIQFSPDYAYYRILYQPAKTFSGSLTPSAAYFTSDVKPEYHRHNTSLHFDFANRNTTPVRLTAEKCDWEVYYIPELPKATGCENFREMPAKYKNTNVYKLFELSQKMFDDLIHYVNDRYDWVNGDFTDLGWWADSLYSSLKSHGEFCHERILSSMNANVKLS